MKATRPTCVTRDSNRRLGSDARNNSAATGMTCQTRKPNTFTRRRPVRGAL